MHATLSRAGHGACAPAVGVPLVLWSLGFCLGPGSLPQTQMSCKQRQQQNHSLPYALALVLPKASGG